MGIRPTSRLRLTTTLAVLLGLAAIAGCTHVLGIDDYEKVSCDGKECTTTFDSPDSGTDAGDAAMDGDGSDSNDGGDAGD